MPDPSKLKIGDRVRFISLPDEWARPGICLPPESVAFMRKMIRRGYSSRISQIEHGGPWIEARIWRRGRWEHHTWGIFESTGWRKVRRRRPNSGCPTTAPPVG